MKSPTKSVSVYVMTCQNRTKIGITDNLKKRRLGLEMSAGVPVRLHYARSFYSRSVASGIERELHRKFADSRLIGEWFSIEPAAAVDALRAVAEPPDLVPDTVYEMIENAAADGDADASLALRHLEASVKGHLLPEIAAIWRREGIYERNMARGHLQPYRHPADKERRA